MQQLRFVTKTDKVAELLRAEILKGSLPAGSQLRQEDIAARLGVSSTPVREAFGILEVEGFVERRAHRGAVVVGVDTVMLEDSYDLRGVLEAFAVERAVARGATATTLAKVEHVLRRAGKAFKAGQLHQFRVESAEFHRQLVNASGSDVLIELHAMLMRRTVFNAPLDRPEMGRYQRIHERIYLAMTKGDAEGARELLTTHMHRVADNVRRAGPNARQDGKAAAI